MPSLMVVLHDSNDENNASTGVCASFLEHDCLQEILQLCFAICR